MLRKFHFSKQREAAFKVSQHVNEVLLPSYNALQDPFLSGYFENPLIKRHLKETGVIKRKRRISMKQKHELNHNNNSSPTGRVGTERKAKSLSKSVNYFQNQVKLPAL